MNIQQNKALREKLSAAYVLGTLKGGARRRFSALLKNSALLEHEVQLWQQRLHPLAEFSKPATPSPQVWRKIAQQLNLGDLVRSERQSFWQSLGNNLLFWRGLGLASSAFAAMLLVVLWVQQPAADLPTSSYVAMLLDDKAQPNLVVVGDYVHHRLTARILTSQTVAANQSLELWAIPKHGSPRSLGLLAKDGSITLPLPSHSTPENITMLAVSLEPAHGSPNHDGPSGPVLFKGSWQQI